MTNIYDQHRAAFAQVSAFVVMRDGNRVATVAIKFPRDGAGRLYAYVHWIGVPMVRGWAGGYGYDKQSAACASASRRMPTLPDGLREDITVTDRLNYAAFRSALAKDDGYGWDRNLEKAGFVILQAV